MLFRSSVIRVVLVLLGVVLVLLGVVLVLLGVGLVFATPMQMI